MYLLTLLLLLTISLCEYQSVDGATCKTVSACQTTDFTLSTCSNDVCNCINSSYTAVRTGCARKLDKPVIIPIKGRSNQVIAGETFTLTCYVVDGATYEWYLGTTKLTETTDTFTQAGASSSNVGSFTCKAISRDPLVISDVSDAFKVELLGTGGLTTSSVQPTIYIPTTTSYTGKTVKLDCYNIPMGYSDTITYKVAGTADSSSITLDSNYEGKDVTCTMTSPSTSVNYLNPTSAAGKLPKIVSSIQSVTVTVEKGILAEVADHLTPTPTLTLTCTYSPDDSYLSAAPTYAWQKDGTVIDGETGATFIPKDEGTYNTTCSVTLGTTVTSSNKVKVTISDNYLTTPILKTSSNNPVVGGRVVLTCGDVRDDQVTYTWTKDSTTIYRQYDRKLQIDKFAAEDDGTYACTINKNRFRTSPISTKLASQSTINKPSIEVTGCGQRLGEKGDYWLKCKTTSETVGMTYEWTIADTKSSTVTGKYYSLPTITSTNNGAYKCKAIFKSVSSELSDIKTVEVTDPGMFCTEDSVCIAAKTGYTGTCDLNDRCLCSDGYTQKGEQCSSAGQKLLGSVVIITTASLLAGFI